MSLYNNYFRVRPFFIEILLCYHSYRENAGLSDETVPRRINTQFFWYLMYQIYMYPRSNIYISAFKYIYPRSNLYISAFKYIYPRLNIYISTFKYISISAFKYIYIFAFKYIYIYPHSNTYLYPHSNIYIYPHSNIYIYIYPHSNIFPAVWKCYVWMPPTFLMLEHEKRKVFSL